MRSAFSKTVTRCPARQSCCAAANPEGPDPTTATLFRERSDGSSGSIQPSAKPRSTMLFSTSLMATAGLLIPRTHAASHGAGQMRPVNSGKLFVACNRRTASRQ